MNKEIKERNGKWFKQISVEPIMTLYMFAFMITSVVEQAFFVRKACLVNHNYTTEICDNLSESQNIEIKKEIQLTVTNFHQWNSICGHVFPIILSLFLGSWSDKRGRKFPLIIGLIGKLIYSSMIIVNDRQKNWPVEYIIFTATLPCALTGADIAIFASCFAYVSDISNVENRTIRVTILDVCYLFAMPTGVALGSYLFNEVFDKSYSLMFTVNASLLAIAIIYSCVVLKWQTINTQKSFKGFGFWETILDFFDKQHVKDSFKVLIRPREMHRRIFLGIILITMALYTFQRDEKPYLFLYTQLKYKWNVKTYSNFKTFQSTAYVLFMLTGIPLMSKVFKWKDTIIVMIGATGHAIARLIYALANIPEVFYIGSVFCSIGPIVGPVLRSMTSKIVPISERGKVFSFLSVCDNAVPLISSVLYTQVYNATIGKMTGIFYLTFATQLAVFMLILVVHIMLKGRSLAVPETDTPTNIISNENDED